MSLKPKVLQLFDEGKRPPEIAEILGCTHRNVGHHLHSEGITYKRGIGWDYPDTDAIIALHKSGFNVQRISRVMNNIPVDFIKDVLARVQPQENNS